MNAPRSTSPATLALGQAGSFSPADWAKLAKGLAGQDRVVLPVANAALPPPRAHAAGEAVHRQASALALVQHWASLGFVLSKADVLTLCAQDPTVHAWLHQHVTPALVERLGGHVAMTPMYPNFPKQVMRLDEAELLFNALLHYLGDWVGARILPVYPTQARRPLLQDQGRERPLRLVDPEGVRGTLAALVAMNTVWTPAQAAVAHHALPLLVAWGLVGPHAALPQRENQAHLTGMWLGEVRAGAGIAWPAAGVSVTDVLRAAVVLAGGDPSLAAGTDKPRWPRLSRPQRRALMAGLDTAVTTTASAADDLHRHRQAWLRLAERLHAGEWAAFPNARTAIDALRNAPAPPSWHAQLDAALAQPADTVGADAVAALVARNPGYAARALRRTLVWAQAGGQAARIEAAFAGVVDRVDTPVLLAVVAAFRADARDGSRVRVMLPQGRPQWRYRADLAARHAVPAALRRSVVGLCKQALLARFAALPPLGKVFVEPGLDAVLLPRGLRTASDSVGVVARGSSLPVSEDAKVVRLFLWWKDTEQGRVDVDLSAVGVDKRFEATETCNYQALKGSGLTHSGDLTSAPEGAAEFIDVVMDDLKAKTRYVVLAANVYHGPGFSALPECFVGWQERLTGQRGEIMELKTVAEKFPVTCSTKGFLGVVFDVRERRVMWLDLPMKTLAHDSIRDRLGEVSAAVEDFTLYAAAQPTVGDLVDLHIQARGGERVRSAKKADTVFSLTPRLAREGQAIVAATRPEAIASALMQGGGRGAAPAPHVPPPALQPASPAEATVPPVKAKVRKPR